MFWQQEETHDWTDTAEDWLAAIGWVALGAGIMYFADPTAGARRRKLVMDKLRRGANVSGRYARGKTMHARNRMRGYAHEARARFTGGSAGGKTEGTAAPQAEGPRQSGG